MPDIRAFHEDPSLLILVLCAPLVLVVPSWVFVPLVVGSRYLKILNRVVVRESKFRLLI